MSASKMKYSIYYKNTILVQSKSHMLIWVVLVGYCFRSSLWLRASIKIIPFVLTNKQ